ncbi:MAG: nitrile hydratase subunit beta [Proteobacteria bacterium]|nr:nitrile hydratase subunit beta [Burkholderiales bacterium]
MSAFAAGDRVAVLDVDVPGHIRTPTYVRGRRGVIEREVGRFRNPEELAYGRSGEPRRMLYRVRFAQRELWADYAGTAHDTIDVDLYEHWLRKL